MWARCRLSVAATCVMACGRLAFDPIGDGDGGPDGPPIGNRAFVTSTRQAPVTFGGLAGADAVCMDRAREAQLPGHFVAWLSSTSLDAEQRLASARGWYRTDNQPLVDTTDDLSNGRMILPLRIDEMGRDIGPGPASEYAVTGTYYGTANATCNDYTSSTEIANVGAPLYTGHWFANVNGRPCSEPSHLYCFQIDLVVPVAVPPASGRTAFVSSGRFTPSSGLAAADAICSAEAAANRLPGTYLALLPGTEPAAARFDAGGPPWVRLDGMPLGTTGDLLGGSPKVALNMDATGTFVDDYVVTAGIAPVDSPDAGRTCDGWTNPAGFSELGVSVATGDNAFSQTTADCARAEPIYCLEE